MIRRPPRYTRTDTLFPTRRSSDLIFEPHITFRRKLRSLADAVDDAAVRRLYIEHGRWYSQHLDTVQGIHCCPRKGRVAVEIAHAVKKLHRRETTNDRSIRSEEHTSELKSLMRISYAVFGLERKKEIKKLKNDN